MTVLYFSRETQGPTELPEVKERIGPPTPVNFYKLGGTWDMVEIEGVRIGTGNLGDAELRILQAEMGLFDANTREARAQVNRKLALEIYRKFQATKPEAFDVAQHLASWATIKEGEFKNFARGPFIPLFSGDSSHLRSYLIVPMIVALLETATREPTKPILGGQGTDTADISLLSMYDVYTYDTQLPPLFLTGANNPHDKPGSDAPGNFVDTARITHVDLESGAYWVFHENLYSAADYIKADPIETRRIEEQDTFWSPHRTFTPIKTALAIGRKANWQERSAPPTEHIINRLTVESLYEAYESVYVMDLGDQNSGWVNMERIFDPEIKAVVVAAHGLGNVDNESRMDLIRAAKMNKLVIDTSRAIVGATDASYEASLLRANSVRGELGGTDKRIIDAHKLNKAVARALATRAIMEGLDQQGAQELFDNYTQPREMF